MIICYGKYATSYDLQIGKYWVAICHLRGDYWKWKPWRRISFHKESD